jgi:hypothetical protein
MRHTFIAVILLMAGICLVHPLKADQSPAGSEELRIRVEKFLADDSSPLAQHPHIYLSILEDIVVHDALLDLAETIVDRGIDVNTIENLRESLRAAAEDIEHEQVYEYSRLYSHKASILLRTGRHGEALATMETAMTYIGQIGEPRPVDFLRLGLIEYASGRLDEGWSHIGDALMMDGTIERHLPQYRTLLAAVVVDMFGDALDMDDYIWEYRRDNRQTVHGLVFTTLSGETINLDDERGKVLCLTFFSPMCMSCREEVPCIKMTFEDLSRRPDVRFLFVLNRPDLQIQAASFFAECGITTDVIATVAVGSAYDLIATEPTIWIADRSGTIVTKLTGESVATPETYGEELMKVLNAGN